jgi:hypothetical protein
MENFSDIKRRRGRPIHFRFKGGLQQQVTPSQRRQLINQYYRDSALNVLKKNDLADPYLLEHKTILTELGRLGQEPAIVCAAKQFIEQRTSTARALAQCRASRKGRFYTPSPAQLSQRVWTFVNQLRLLYPKTTDAEIAEALDAISLEISRPPKP